MYKKGFSLGAFDLFHVGHLRYLEHSKAMCEYLIVGVAPDFIAIQSKGYGAITPLQQRIEIINSLKCVNEALALVEPIANTADAAAWIVSLGVDVVFCGQEWRGSTKWNALTQALLPKGIVVEFIPPTDGISTTKIKEKISS